MANCIGAHNLFWMTHLLLHSCFNQMIQRMVSDLKKTIILLLHSVMGFQTSMFCHLLKFRKNSGFARNEKTLRHFARHNAKIHLAEIKILGYRHLKTTSTKGAFLRRSSTKYEPTLLKLLRFCRMSVYFSHRFDTFILESAKDVQTRPKMSKRPSRLQLFFRLTDIGNSA